MKVKPKSWHSSYEENNYGELFYALIRIYQPEKVVELGTRAGYSAYHIARGLKDNGIGKLHCYDLFENYVEHLGSSVISKSATEENLKEFKDIISLTLCDAVGIDKKYKTVDILHVDLDNDGEILEKIVPAWIDKVRQLIIIEGGSIERDQLAATTNYKKLPVTKWLNDFNDTQAKSLKKIIADPVNGSDQFVVVVGNEKYKEKPIAEWLKNFCDTRSDIEYITLEPFPSLTIIIKK